MSTPPPPPGFNPPPPGYGAPQQPQYGAPPQPYGGAPQQYGGAPPGYQAYQQQGPTNQYAGIGARFGAVLIDGLISALFTAPGIVALFAGPKNDELQECTVDGSVGFCEVPSGLTWALFAVLLTVGFLAYLVIYCKKVGNSQSWGQKACGVRVVDKASGAQIGTGRAVGRYFARFLSSSLCGLGYFWALWDKDKQTWHDKIVSSVVVKA